jgi:hypothetical protein
VFEGAEDRTAAAALGGAGGGESGERVAGFAQLGDL